MWCKYCPCINLALFLHLLPPDLPPGSTGCSSLAAQCDHDSASLGDICASKWPFEMALSLFRTGDLLLWVIAWRYFVDFQHYKRMALTLLALHLHLCFIFLLYAPIIVLKPPGFVLTPQVQWIMSHWFNSSHFILPYLFLQTFSPEGGPGVCVKDGFYFKDF